MSTKSISTTISGDSGDGIQLLSNLLLGCINIQYKSLIGYPVYPAEIRAPKNTVDGLSTYHIIFSKDKKVRSFTGTTDLLLSLNPAGLSVNLKYLHNESSIIIDSTTFTEANIKKSNLEESIINDIKNKYQVYDIPIINNTKKIVSELNNPKRKYKYTNMYILGLLTNLYGIKYKDLEDLLISTFNKNNDILLINQKVSKIGYDFPDIVEISLYDSYSNSRLNKDINKIAISGNTAVVKGLKLISDRLDKKIFFSSYPITPASTILQQLKKVRNDKMIVFQSEDEISSIGSAIGASYGGSISITASSGPGISLKSEMIGLAIKIEIPLLILDVQRSGPSTGMPTKTEQSDLLQAYFGRHGDTSIPILALYNPCTTLDILIEAIRIMVKYMTPVFLLSDAYISNSIENFIYNEEWYYKSIDNIIKELKDNSNPLKRDKDRLAREWYIPGLLDKEHILSGLEQKNESSDISYDPSNHKLMTEIRNKKIEQIQYDIPKIEIDIKNQMSIVSWGSTYGVINDCMEILSHKYDIKYDHIHLVYLSPLQMNLEESLEKYKRIIVIENNNQQLYKILKMNFPLKNLISYTEITGEPLNFNAIFKMLKDLYEKEN